MSARWQSKGCQLLSPTKDNNKTSYPQMKIVLGELTGQIKNPQQNHGVKYRE